MIQARRRNFRPFHALTNDEKGHYLAGLIEGDGCFGSECLSIAFNQTNRLMAENIAFNFPSSTIYDRTEPGATKCNLTICGDSLNKAIDLVNGCLVGDAKVNQLMTLVCETKRNVVVLPPTNVVNPNTPWIAGFLEADGCMIIEVKTSTHGGSAKPMVVFVQKDPQLLHCIQ